MVWLFRQRHTKGTETDNPKVVIASSLLYHELARLFPPQHRKAFHEAVLLEILEERVVSSRTRRNHRGLKRKMSGYPLRPRKVACNDRFEFGKCVKILN
jgi:hypothetical protein